MKIYQDLSKIIIVVIVLISSFCTAEAAVMSINPPLSSISAGNIVTAQITVNTEGVAINSAEAQILFPADILEVVSIDKSNSIFSLWVEGPTFSNTAGTIVFSGGIPNPGYNGTAGKIMSVVFKAKKTGSASVLFSNSNIMANDGSGTNVAKATAPSVVSVQPASASLEVVNKVDTTVKLPPLPIVTSSTHPDEDAWYASDKVRFDWDVPKGIVEIQTLLSRSATAVPNISRDGTFSAVSVNDLMDGTLYFHIRYRNAGGWGPILHRKVLTDTTAPKEFAPKIENDDFYSYVVLDAKDEMSGINRYEISIDGEDAIKINPQSLVDGKYRLPVVNGGAHNLEVEVYDNAGNERKVNITYDSPTIQAPEIISFPSSVVMNQSIEIVGESIYPNTTVIVYLQSEGRDIKALKTTTDNSGKFKLVFNHHEENSLFASVIDTSGVITIWAQNMFENGVLGPTSDKVYTTVENTSLMKFAYGSIKTMSLMIPLIALVIVLIILVYIGWHRFFGLKRKIHKDAMETIDDIHEAMTIYKDELISQLEVLESISEDRDLNRKEEKIFKGLVENINKVEKFLERKLRKY